MPLGDAITKQARKRYSFLSENDQKSDTVKERIRCSENRVQTNSVFKSKNESSEVSLSSSGSSYLSYLCAFKPSCCQSLCKHEVSIH